MGSDEGISRFAVSAMAEVTGAVCSSYIDRDAGKRNDCDCGTPPGRGRPKLPT